MGHILRRPNCTCIPNKSFIISYQYYVLQKILLSYKCVLFKRVFFSSHELYIEMACNELFGAGEGSQIAPPNPSRTYTLKTAQIVAVDTKVRQLLLDMEVLVDLIKVRKITAPDNTGKFLIAVALLIVAAPQL